MINLEDLSIIEKLNNFFHTQQCSDGQSSDVNVDVGHEVQLSSLLKEDDFKPAKIHVL
jgi:hypothetical protein